MSCKEIWAKEVAGRLSGNVFVASGGVPGADTCIHEGCEAKINQATGKCTQGHAQHLAGATLPYPQEAEALLCVLGEHGADSEDFWKRRALARRLAVEASQQPATEAMEEAAGSVLDALRQLVLLDLILTGEEFHDADGSYYEDVLQALALTYGDEEMPGAMVEKAVREGVFHDEALVKAAAGPLFYALEALVGQRLISAYDIEKVAPALAMAYGDESLSTNGVWSTAITATRWDQERAERPEDDFVRNLLWAVDNLRDEGTDLEGDPRVQAARAYQEERDRAWWEADTFVEACDEWPGTAEQLFEEAFYQATGESIAAEARFDPKDLASDEGLPVFWWEGTMDASQGILHGASQGVLRGVFGTVPPRTWDGVEVWETKALGDLRGSTVVLPDPARRWSDLQAVRDARSLIRRLREAPPDPGPGAGDISVISFWESATSPKTGMAVPRAPAVAVIYVVGSPDSSGGAQMVRYWAGMERDLYTEEFSSEDEARVAMEVSVRHFRSTGGSSHCSQCGLFLPKGGGDHECLEEQGRKEDNL